MKDQGSGEVNALLHGRYRLQELEKSLGQIAAQLRDLAAGENPAVQPALQVGALDQCVLDVEPRVMTAPEVDTLEDLAAMVMSELELRLDSRRARNTN